MAVDPSLIILMEICGSIMANIFHVLYLNVNKYFFNWVTWHSITSNRIYFSCNALIFPKFSPFSLNHGCWPPFSKTGPKNTSGSMFSVVASSLIDHHEALLNAWRKKFTKYVNFMMEKWMWSSNTFMTLKERRVRKPGISLSKESLKRAIEANYREMHQLQNYCTLNYTRSTLNILFLIPYKIFYMIAPFLRQMLLQSLFRSWSSTIRIFFVNRIF